MDTDKDRMAKHLAEIREREQALDREDGERATRESDLGAAVIQRRRGGSLRSFLFMVALFLVVAGLFGLAVTLHRWAGKDMDDARRTGTATVSSCIRHGPVTNRGFGHWESCEVRIGWDSGELEAATVGASFTSADIGSTVRVGDLGMHRGDRQLARADEPRRLWLAWLGYAVTAIAVVPALVWVLLMREVLRFRRK